LVITLAYVMVVFSRVVIVGVYVVIVFGGVGLVGCGGGCGVCGGWCGDWDDGADGIFYNFFKQIFRSANLKIFVSCAIEERASTMLEGFPF
jgi:hypothetical protein